MCRFPHQEDILCWKWQSCSATSRHFRWWRILRIRIYLRMWRAKAYESIAEITGDLDIWKLGLSDADKIVKT